MHQVRARERCPETFDQSTSGLIVQDDSDQDAIGAPLDPLGRAVQLYVRPVPRALGSGEAGHEIRLLAEIIEQFLPQFAARDQRQTHPRCGHGIAFATLPKRR